MKNNPFVILLSFCLLFSCLAISGCYPPPDRPAGWIKEILSGLECGLSPEEVQDLTDRQIRELDGWHWFLGSHKIETPWYAIWFRFEDGKLHAVTWGVAEDSKTDRLSPRRNLCTGDLSFLLMVLWTADFVGSDVYLDGELLAEDADRIPQTELSAGHHVLRIERPDGGVVVRELQLGPTDRGDQRLILIEGISG